MKFESFGDFFKYNKELFEDDYNKDQALVVKTKSKATDNVTVSPRPSNLSQEEACDAKMEVALFKA
jgi:hypothetical protein